MCSSLGCDPERLQWSPPRPGHRPRPSPQNTQVLPLSGFLCHSPIPGSRICPPPQRILSFAILKFLTYSEYKTFLGSVIEEHLSPNNKWLPFSLQETWVMKSSFPPHTHSPMWCSQQVPVRFFRSENEFCCLSVSLCSQLAPRAVFLQKSTSLLQTEALENRYIYWSLKLWSHQRASELNPSYRTCLPRELSFLKLGGVDLVWACLAGQTWHFKVVHPFPGIRPHSIYFLLSPYLILLQRPIILEDFNPNWWGEKAEDREVRGIAQSHIGRQRKHDPQSLASSIQSPHSLFLQ